MHSPDAVSVFDAYGSMLARSEERIIGEHLEAVAQWLRAKDERENYTDGGRRRDLIELLQEVGDPALPPYEKGWGVQSQLYNGQQHSIIIPVQNEEAVIAEGYRLEKEDFFPFSPIYVTFTLYKE
jgi:hypothetical protein